MSFSGVTNLGESTTQLSDYPNCSSVNIVCLALYTYCKDSPPARNKNS